jgi:hypothetical protein
MASLAGRAVTIVRGEGATVFDAAGRPYLDAIASLWYSNVGHGRAELADAAAAQMGQLAAYQTFEPFSNPPAEALARRGAGLAPVAGAKVFFTPGGGVRKCRRYVQSRVPCCGMSMRPGWGARHQPGSGGKRASACCWLSRAGYSERYTP